MQRLFLPAAGALFALALSSCCTPCKERAAARKAAAEARYGAGSPGALPNTVPAPAPPANPQQPTVRNW